MLDIGTLVNYHGSKKYYHGLYIVTAHSDLSSRWPALSSEELAEYYPDGVAYTLRPVTDDEDADDDGWLYYVRPTSISELKSMTTELQTEVLVGVVRDTVREATMHTLSHETLNQVAENVIDRLRRLGVLDDKWGSSREEQQEATTHLRATG